MSENGKNYKIKELQGQVNEVTHLLRDDMEKVLERGENIENLQERSEDLQSGSVQFKARSKDLRKKMCCRNAKMTFILVIVIVVIIVIITIIVLVTLKPWNTSGGGSSHGGNFTSHFAERRGIHR